MKYTIVRLLVPLLLGILLKIGYHNCYSFIFYLPGGTFIILLYCHYNKKISQSYQYRWVYGIFLNLLMIQIGITLVAIQYNPPEYNKYETTKTYIGVIKSNPEKKNTRLKTVAEIQGHKVMLNLEFDDSVVLSYGDIIIFNARLKEITNSGNPNEFNYKKYLSNHNIFLQAYIPVNKWKKTDQVKPSLTRFAHKTRNTLLSIYIENGLKNDLLAIPSALTLGYKSNLSNEVKQAFAATGAIHYLAVSGLHVGIIYIIFNFLLRSLSRYKYGKLINAFLLITIIWFYALLTGLSPSVQRAATMFSIISLGKISKKQTNIYQSLSLSAFISLLADPFSITNIGFQLSYAAVFGIAYYQPKIYKLIIIRNSAIDKLWLLSTVSIAAQITTFPITVFYFDQFPILFLISNIIVLPFVIAIISFSLLLFIFSFSSLLSSFLTIALSSLTTYLYKIIYVLHEQPGVLIKDIHFYLPHVVFTYALVFFTTAYLNRKVKLYIYLILCAVIFLQAYNTILLVKVKHQKKVTIYNVKNHPVYGLFHGNQCYIISNSKSNIEQSKVNYAIKNDLIKSGIKTKNLIHLQIDSITGLNNGIFFRNLTESNNKIINFQGLKLLIIVENFKYKIPSHDKLEVDFIILSNNPGISISKLEKFFIAKKIIFDSSNSYYNLNKWIKECEEFKFPYHSIQIDKAFKVTL